MHGPMNSKQTNKSDLKYQVLFKYDSSCSKLVAVLLVNVHELSTYYLHS